MKRMVAYIYLYKKNNNILSKCENMGFCRVWQNSNKYIVNLCLKDSCGVNGTLYISTLKKKEKKDDRYIYCKNNIDICKTMVGGTLNLKLEVDENDGIYVECGGRIYITLWNECVKDIEIVEKTESIVANSYVEKTQNVRENLYVDNSESARENSYVNNSESARENSYVKKVEDIKKNLCVESQESTREDSNTQNVKNIDKKIYAQNTEKTEFEQYTRIYNRLCKVRMILNEVEYPAVKLKLHELMLLPRSCWRMANNIFLMESYYMYGHILFMQYRGKYILAVPGQNKRGVDVMAKQCGFLEHVIGYEYGRKKDSKVYWIKEL